MNLQKSIALVMGAHQASAKRRRSGSRRGFSVAPAGAEESSIEQARSIFETNFFGIVRMTRVVVPHMRHRRSGRIFNIGSVLGLLPMPYMALYAATKHAIEGYSESLDHELRTRGIRVSVIEPANTRTQFDANLLQPDVKLAPPSGRTCVSPRIDRCKSGKVLRIGRLTAGKVFTSRARRTTGGWPW